ncbi:hypothetical protein FVQ89_00470 [Homoserinibacter sp. GY 40078]|nr:hypothetical protein FVQ89_00470 [Homoserinibacter sp. GY 40078]
MLASADSDWVLALLALGPVGASVFYWAVWMSYRNTNKSHSFERETAIAVDDMRGDDVKIGTNNGTTARTIRGMNSDEPRRRL